MAWGRRATGVGKGEVEWRGEDPVRGSFTTLRGGRGGLNPIGGGFTARGRRPTSLGKGEAARAWRRRRSCVDLV